MSSTNKSVFTPQYTLFLARLKAARKRAGLRQDELGALLGEYQTFVSRCESGERRVDVVELRAFCRALQIPFVEFVAILDQDLAVLDGPASQSNPATGENPNEDFSAAALSKGQIAVESFPSAPNPKAEPSIRSKRRSSR